MFEAILTLILSIIAGIVEYYICKWLDRKNGGSST